MIRILMLEPDAADAARIQAALEQSGIPFTAQRVATLQALRKALARFMPHVILAEYRLPRTNALEVLRSLDGRAPGAPFILVTSSQNEATAVACMKAGAADYVLKSDLKRLPAALREALAKAETVRAEESAVAQLRRSEELNRRILEAVPGGVVLIARDGTILYANTQATQIMGMTGNIPGRHTACFVHHAVREDGSPCPPEEWPATRCLNSGQPQPPTTIGVRRPDGAITWVVLTATPVLEPGTGSVSAVVVTFLDITARKRAEDALRDSEEHARRLLECTADAVCLHDPSGRYVSVNQHACEALGYTRAELLNLSAADLLPDFIPEVFEELWRTLRPWVPITLQDRVRRKDGSIVPVESRVSLVEWSGRQLLLVVSRDVSERKRVEEALRESQERYRAFVAQSSEAIWRFELEQPIPVDLPEDEQIEMCYQYASLAECNDAMARMYGFTRAEELLGARLSALMDRSDPKNTEYLRAVIRGGYRVVDAESHELDRQGRSTYFLNSFMAVIEDGKLVRGWGTQRDITERKKAEQDLRESEERYRLLFHNNPHPMWLVNIDTFRFLDVNDAAMRHYGYAREEFLAMSMMDIRPPEDVPRAREFVAKLAPGLHVNPMLFRHRKKDGSLIDVETAGYTFAHGGQRISLVLSYDVTERRRAEDALRDSEARFKSAFDNAPIGMALVASDGCFLRTNQAHCAITGYSEHELLSLRFHDFVHPDDLQDCVACTRQMLAREISVAQFEKRHIRKDGRVIWCQVNLSPICDPQGRVLYLIAQVQDITERRRAEEALRQESTRLRLMLEQMPAMLWTTDTELRFTSSVGSGLRVLGAQPGQVVGMTLFEYFKTSDPEFPGIAPHRRALAGKASTFEIDWAGRVFQTHVEPLRDVEDRIVGVIGVALDITAPRRTEKERQALERKLQETQKTESLGVLAGGIAHDFNNLLAAILGNVSLAHMQLPKESPTRPYLASIETAAHRAADLCKQMLAYAGRSRFVVQSLNVNTIIQEMANLLRISIGKHVILKLDLAPSLPLVLADATQIRQVVMNLILNAAEAIGENTGAISLATGVCHAARAALADTYLAPDLPEGEYLFIEVADTGCGMDEQTTARIFDPFFSTKFTGRGLGLAAVLGIVRSHKGAIKVTSSPGDGSTFRILLPCGSTREQTPTPSSDRIHPKLQGTVLVVEEDETLRLLQGRMLESLGLRSLLATGGQQAIDLLQTHRSEIVAVLLHMTLPGLSAEETYRAMCRVNPELRTILMSGYDQRDAVARYGNSQRVRFLQKPFTPLDLYGELKDLLGQP
ncbi:MAG: PAS domain S-box protein [Planctomycetota bacterium]|nr:PAS domain S-box protein [Planctomycetota bacterium]